MLPYGPALYTGLWGLIGVGANLSIIGPLVGFNNVGFYAHNVDIYGGVLLFSIYSAYDTHVMINDFKNGNCDYIGHATNFFFEYY